MLEQWARAMIMRLMVRLSFVAASQNASLLKEKPTFSSEFSDPLVMKIYIYIIF